MTLAKTLLQKVPEWRPAAHIREVLAISAEDSGWRLRISADRCDELAAALWDLTFERFGEHGVLTIEQLRSWAANAARTHGLPEPLTVLEVDAARGEALLRSADPTERDDALLYYEIVLSAQGRARVCRYRAGRDRGEREQTPFVLTHEALASLSAELTETAVTPSV